MCKFKKAVFMICRQLLMILLRNNGSLGGLKVQCFSECLCSPFLALIASKPMSLEVSVSCKLLSNYTLYYHFTPLTADIVRIAYQGVISHISTKSDNNILSHTTHIRATDMFVSCTSTGRASLPLATAHH